VQYIDVFFFRNGKDFIINSHDGIRHTNKVGIQGKANETKEKKAIHPKQNCSEQEGKKQGTITQQNQQQISPKQTAANQKPPAPNHLKKCSILMLICHLFICSYQQNKKMLAWTCSLSLYIVAHIVML
jgi:hypothetical protein